MRSNVFLSHWKVEKNEENVDTFVKSDGMDRRGKVFLKSKMNEGNSGSYTERASDCE